MSITTVQHLLPEIWLIAAAVLIYIAGAFFQVQKLWRWVALAGIILAAVYLPRHHGGLDGGGLISDSFTIYLRWLVLGLSSLLVLMNFKPSINGGTPEALGSLLLIIAGAMLLVSANDLILLFASLELISIPTYILLYLGPPGAGVQESTVKYFYLSVLSSALLLYGFSFIYGVAGSTDLKNIGVALGSIEQMPSGFVNLAKLALVLTFSGLSFRIAAVPFHFYAPDVYQGTTNQNAALLSVIPKAAGLAVLVRLVLATMPELDTFAWRITIIVAILSMTLGNTMALWQNNLRRLMAYSSIAHAGYLLIGLAAAFAAGENPPNSWDGMGAMLFYLCVYSAATIGTFAILEFLGSTNRRLSEVDELAGLCRSYPISAAMIAVFMISLIGIPPLAGFWGKLQIFGSALGQSLGNEGPLRVWFLVVAIVGVLNAAISAGYYLRIVGMMYFRPSSTTPKGEGGMGAWTTGAICALFTILLGVYMLGNYPGPLLRESNNARPVIKQILSVEKTIDNRR